MVSICLTYFRYQNQYEVGSFVIWVACPVLACELERNVAVFQGSSEMLSCYSDDINASDYLMKRAVAVAAVAVAAVAVYPVIQGNCSILQCPRKTAHIPESCSQWIVV